MRPLAHRRARGLDACAGGGDTDQPVTVAARQEDLDAAILPFQAAIDAGVDMVMVSSASYPALGPDKPAVFAKPIVTTSLRERLGFEGVVITDDMEAIAISELNRAPGTEAVAAIGAGCDLVLYARSDRGAVAGFNATVAAAKSERGDKDLSFFGAAAKCYASDVAMKVTTDAVQLLGGAGYTKDFPLERMMRDAKITQIYEGTNRIQRIVMARQLLKR